MPGETTQDDSTWRDILVTGRVRGVQSEKLLMLGLTAREAVFVPVSGGRDPGADFSLRRGLIERLGCPFGSVFMIGDAYDRLVAFPGLDIAAFSPLCANSLRW